MRRAPKSGPALSFKPDDVVTFKHAKRENGVEVLQGTIEITNSSSRAVNFRFGDDPEFKFSPQGSCIAPRSTTVVFATFYNVDGHCRPRRSSVVLRSIRVRSDDQQEIERLWKRTPSELVGEKRWKLRFEKHLPPGTASSPTPCTKRRCLLNIATTGADDGKCKATHATGTSKLWLSASARAAACARGFSRSQLVMAVAVMGATVLTAYHALWIVKSRHAPEFAYKWTTYRATASKPLARAAEGARRLLVSQMPWVGVVMVACLALWLVKFVVASHMGNLAIAWATWATKARKSTLLASNRALKNASALLRSRLSWIIAAMGAVAVLITCRVVWLLKSRHLRDSDDCVTIFDKTYCF